MKNKDRVLRMTETAVLAALGIVLMLFVRFPLIPSVPYLKYDMGDIPVLTCSLLFGPIYGICCLFIVCLIEAFTVSTTGLIGFIMHFAASGVFVLAASLIYKKLPTIVGLIIGLLSGTLIMTALMVPLNVFLTPLYAPNVSPKDVLGLLLPAILPFNLLKGLLNSVVTALIFAALSNLLYRQSLLPEGAKPLKKSINRGHIR